MKLRFAICFWVPFVFVFGLLGPQSTRAEARAGAEDRGQQGKQGGSGSGPQDQGQGQGQGYGHGQGEEAAKMGGGAPAEEAFSTAKPAVLSLA